MIITLNRLKMHLLASDIILIIIYIKLFMYYV